VDREPRETESRQQFTHLWIEAEPSVSAYVFAAISGFHDAEDVVQQIAQELARRFEQYASVLVRCLTSVMSRTCQPAELRPRLARPPVRCEFCLREFVVRLLNASTGISRRRVQDERER
jgi:hypothetical protein